MTDTYTSTKNAPKAWVGDAVGDLVVRPTMDESVAIQALGAVSVDEHASGFRIPVVGTDPVATWSAEGSEIAPSTIGIAEDADRFHRLAALTVATQEMIDDSDPAIADAVAAGLGRDIARKLDVAFFGKRPQGATAEDQPRGLGDIAGINTIAAGNKITNLDPFTDARYAAKVVGADLAAFIASPEDARVIAKVKDRTDSNRALLQPDPTQPGATTIGGVPFLATPAVTKGTIWGLPKDRITIAIRKGAELDVDKSAFFTSFRVALRSVLRATFLYAHPQAIQKITIG